MLRWRSCERWSGFKCWFFFSSRRRHTRYWRDWSSDVCSSDLRLLREEKQGRHGPLERSARLSGRAVAPALAVGTAIWTGSGQHDEPVGAAYCLRPDRKSVVQGKSVDIGGRCIIKKKKGARQTL